MTALDASFSHPARLHPQTLRCVYNMRRVSVTSVRYRCSLDHTRFAVMPLHAPRNLWTQLAPVPPELEVVIDCGEYYVDWL